MALRRLDGDNVDIDSSQEVIVKTNADNIARYSSRQENFSYMSPEVLESRATERLQRPDRNHVHLHHEGRIFMSNMLLPKLGFNCLTSKPQIESNESHRVDNQKLLKAPKDLAGPRTRSEKLNTSFV